MTSYYIPMHNSIYAETEKYQIQPSIVSS